VRDVVERLVDARPRRRRRLDRRIAESSTPTIIVLLCSAPDDREIERRLRRLYRDLRARQR